MKSPIRALHFLSGPAATTSGVIATTLLVGAFLLGSQFQVREAEQQLEARRKEADCLEERGAMLRRRLAMRQLIARELIDERISLADAIAQFVEINLQDPAILEGVRRNFPGGGYEEATAGQVLKFVKNELQFEPVRSQQVLERLHRELDEWRAGGSCRTVATPSSLR